MFRDTFRTLKRYPFSFFFLQFFDGISESVLFFLGEPTDGSSILYIATVFPLTWFMTCFGTAATFNFFQQIQSGAEPRKSDAISAVFKKWKPLVLSEAIVAIAVLIGIFLIVPAIYFLAVYLFVPCVVMSRQRLPVFGYLSESQAIARNSMGGLLALACVVLVLGLGLSEIQSLVTSALHIEAVWALFLINIVLSMALNMTLNTFICHCFVQLAGNSKCSMKSPNESTK